VAHAVRSFKIDERRLSGQVFHGFIDGGRGSICQKDRSRLGTQLQDVTRPIVFLIRSRPLMPLDNPVIVIVQRIAGGNAGLRVIAALKAI
jgi:hypothetical protein